jgi:hypothetical protein
METRTRITANDLTELSVRITTETFEVQQSKDVRVGIHNTSVRNSSNGRLFIDGQPEHIKDYVYSVWGEEAKVADFERPKRPVETTEEVL